MLRRLITKLEKILRLPKVMSEPVQAAQEKRSGEDISDASKAKKQKGIHEGLADRKRKVALLIGYNGKGYYGLQRNPGFKSIEGEICQALLNVGVIPQNHFDKMQKMSWQRAARTDKNVSAASNVISLKMLLNVENLLDKINAELPPDIRVFDCKRTVNSFNSKNFCDFRSYLYMVPTLAFAPVEEVVDYSYRTTPEIIEHVNKVLKMYLGTHPFHNFTSGMTADQKKCKRYIKYIGCGDPFVRNNTEFVVISILGQSFMMHQIRKMIGLCIAIVKGYCGEDIISKSWSPTKLDIPKAPGLGLVLEKPHYDVYNKRFGNDGQHEPLDWSLVQDKIDQFKEERIFSEIIKTEIEESSIIEWCGTLHRHSFKENFSRYTSRRIRTDSDQSGSSDSENVAETSDEVHKTCTANQTPDDSVSVAVSANQNEDDRLSQTNQKSDNKIDSVAAAETEVMDKQTETEVRDSVEEGRLDGRSSTECQERRDEKVDIDESMKQEKQAVKIP